MTPVTQEIINYFIVYIGIIVGLFFILNFLTKGFLWQYLRVKTSRGRFILTKIKSVKDTYYRPGRITEGFFIFKNREKETKRISIEEDFKHRLDTEMGVAVVECDEEGTKFYDHSIEGVVAYQTIDPGRIQSLFLRIKNRPVIDDKKQTLIILGIIACIVLCGLLLFKTIKIEETLLALKSLSGNL